MNNNAVDHLSRRNDYEAQLKKQAAANALQQYSLLALHSLKDDESPAKTRLKMMRIMTDLPAPLTQQAKLKRSMSQRTPR